MPLCTPLSLVEIITLPYYTHTYMSIAERWYSPLRKTWTTAQKQMKPIASWLINQADLHFQPDIYNVLNALSVCKCAGVTIWRQLHAVCVLNRSLRDTRHTRNLRPRLRHFSHRGLCPEIYTSKLLLFLTYQFADFPLSLK